VTTCSILGTGGIGGALASHFARKSIPVRVASKSRAEKLADKLGGTVRATTFAEALTADIVFLSEGGRLQHFGGSLVGLNLLRHPD
jgi:predicted dinucleotide-binding enzyme